MWRLNWDTSAGPVADMGPHYFEFAQWVRADELGGPVEFEGEGEFRRDPKFNNIPFWLNVRARYADGMHEEQEGGPALREWINGPVQDGRTHGEHGGKCEAAQQAFLDPGP
jgi:hypothetical protein